MNSDERQRMERLERLVTHLIRLLENAKAQAGRTEQKISFLRGTTGS
jgi:hypothetical protein